MKVDEPGKYIAKTESAVKKIFEGIDSYLSILKKDPVPIYLGDTAYAENGTALALSQTPDYQNWVAENGILIQQSINTQREFIAESFAFAVLCGSLLQIAAMGIQWFSTNSEVPANLPQDLHDLIKTPAKKFCVGRTVYGVPIGLIIYAGRNQYNHMDEKELNPLNQKIFELLATRNNTSSYKDPAFDLSGNTLSNLSSNVTGLLEWRDYKAYYADMELMLPSIGAYPDLVG
jgi:hypothetical protein